MNARSATPPIFAGRLASTRPASPGMEAPGGSVQPYTVEIVDSRGMIGAYATHWGRSMSMQQSTEHAHHDHPRHSHDTATPATAAGTIYTCPMHRQVRQVGPGLCAICGMALEPEMPSVDDDESPELKDFARRFCWTLPLTAIVFVIAMLGDRVPLSPTIRSWIELALSAPVVIWAGWPFFQRCVQSIRNRSPNMWTLIGIGVAAAFGFGVVATVAPGVFPAEFHEHGRVAVYFEAAAVIVSLTLLGQLLELRARSKTSAAIRVLLGLAPKTARRVAADGTEADVPLDHVVVADVLRVRPGEKVP